MNNIPMEDLFQVYGGKVNHTCKDAIIRLRKPDSTKTDMLDAIMYCQNLSIADYNESFVAALTV